MPCVVSQLARSDLLQNPYGAPCQQCHLTLLPRDESLRATTLSTYVVCGTPERVVQFSRDLCALTQMLASDQVQYLDQRPYQQHMPT